MGDVTFERVHVVPGGGQPSISSATVVLDETGVLLGVEPAGTPAGLMLVPAAVDLHLDNVRERRRPRATVELALPNVVASLDAECAAAGVAVVCVSARCEEAPAKGVVAEDAVRLAAVVEDLAPSLACDWRVHPRVEVTDDRAVDALAGVLAASTRVALVSVMEHSADRTRFASVEDHRRFYAEDWGVPLEQVDEVLAAKRAGAASAHERRAAAAALARQAGVVLASHDDRTPDDVDEAFALGARVAEFPLTLAAARRAKELGMATVLGAPNVVRGRSTSPGNLLATEAVRAGVLDVLCSDYLPAALQEAPFVLDADGVLALSRGVDLVARAPARVLGLDHTGVEVGRPLTAALRAVRHDVSVGLALWREGRLVFARPDVMGVGRPVRGAAEMPEPGL